MIRAAAAPREAMLSRDFRVYVSSPRTGVEEELSVYTALTSDGISNVYPLPPDVCREFDGLSFGNIALRTCFASLDADEPVQVRVVYSRDAAGFQLRPESLHRTFQRSGSELSFTVSPGEKLVVEADGDIFGSLKLFCNPLSRPDGDGENFIEFKPGYYTAQNCPYIRVNEYGVPVMDCIPDHSTVYLHDGAVLCAAIVLGGKHHVRICGHGVVSLLERCCGADNGFSVPPLYGGFRAHALPNVYIRSGCSHIEIEGIVLNCEFRGIVLRNCEDISIRNVKILTSSVNGDGINLMNTRRLSVSDCYIQSADDCFAIFTACDSVPTFADSEYDAPLPVSADIDVSGCLLFTSARPFMVGGHATGCVSPHDRIENVCFHDTEVLEIASRIHGVSEEHARYWSSAFRVLSQTEQHIKNIEFRSIRVHWTRGYTGKPFHIEVRSDQSASYTEKRGYRIENVRFDGIFFDRCPPRMLESVLYSDFTDNDAGEDYGIDGVSFENVFFNGAPMTAGNAHIDAKGNVSRVCVNGREEMQTSADTLRTPRP